MKWKKSRRVGGLERSSRTHHAQPQKDWIRWRPCFQAVFRIPKLKFLQANGHEMRKNITATFAIPLVTSRGLVLWSLSNCCGRSVGKIIISLGASRRIEASSRNGPLCQSLGGFVAVQFN